MQSKKRNKLRTLKDSNTEEANRANEEVYKENY